MYISTRLVRKRILSFASLLFSPMLFAGDLTIEVNGLRNTKGKLQIAVYDHEKAYKAYNTNKTYATISKSIHKGVNIITLHKVPHGNYAISLFHDENNDKTLAMSRTNMPKEGYGTSNARDKYDEVPFNRAKIRVLDSNQKVRINLYYMGRK